MFSDKLRRQLEHDYSPSSITTMENQLKRLHRLASRPESKLSVKLLLNFDRVWKTVKNHIDSPNTRIATINTVAQVLKYVAPSSLPTQQRYRELFLALRDDRTLPPTSSPKRHRERPTPELPDHSRSFSWNEVLRMWRHSHKLSETGSKQNINLLLAGFYRYLPPLRPEILRKLHFGRKSRAHSHPPYYHPESRCLKVSRSTPGVKVPKQLAALIKEVHPSQEHDTLLFPDRDGNELTAQDLNRRVGRLFPGRNVSPNQLRRTYRDQVLPTLTRESAERRLRLMGYHKK